MSAIDDKYTALGGPKSFLGQPASPEQTCPDGTGKFRHFQGGSIYWTPQTGAYEVHGLIREKWSNLGWERSFLGYPLTDETSTPDKVGRYNHFQGGSIYWTPQTGAYEVHGAIRDRWASLGWERSFLGYPVTDETPTSDNVGRYNKFQGGSIYWDPQTGAHELQGKGRQNFKVTLQSFEVVHLRSGTPIPFKSSKDTDYVALSVAIGSGGAQTLTKAMGDVGHGVFPVNLTFDNLSIADDEVLVVTYSIINKGHGSPGDIEKALQTVTSGLAKKGADLAAQAVSPLIGAALGAELGSAIPVPLVGTALGALAGYLTEQLWHVVLPDCDGPVANAVRTYTGAQLRAVMAGGGRILSTDHHPGVDSNKGCGDNSYYNVTWSMSA